MNRDIDVRTGESVAIRFELAGVGSRFLAMSIDFAIQIGALLAVFFGLALLGWSRRAIPVVAPTKVENAILIGLLAIFVFVLFFGYFIIFELWWSGRTPGKRALGIRVVRDAGFPIDIGAAVIRNLVRVLEFGLGLYAISAISALLSRENKRLGDFAAGTIVVRDRTIAGAQLDAYLARETSENDGVSAADRALIERFMVRRAQLEPHARAALAAQIATRVRPTLRASFDHLSDEDLVTHLGRGALERPARIYRA